MTSGNVKVSLAHAAVEDLGRQPGAVVEAAREAISRLEANPQHLSLAFKRFASTGSVFIFRLSAEYRALVVALSPDQLLLVCVDHRRNSERFSAVAQTWIRERLTSRDESALLGVSEAANATRAPARSAAWATTWASRLAGPQRAHLYDEWAAVLAGAPEMDMALRPAQQRMLAVGFLFAAIRLRARDSARPLWLPVDWLLRAPSRTNAFIATVVGGQAILIVGDGGLAALLTEVWEPCGIAGASLFGLARWLRRVRGIELAASDRGSAGE
ncbi:hypothetical protein BKA18_003042 [Streptomyces auratus]